MTYADGPTNPFLSHQDELTPEDPVLDDVMAETMRQIGMDLRVAMPCSIHAVKGNQLVDLQPLLMSSFLAAGIGPAPLPIITNAQVAMPMGATYGIKYPLAVGDVGVAIFCDRSLDNWASGNGAIADPADSRTHDLTDAIFYPGLVTVSGQTTDTTTDLTVTNGTGSLRISKAGQFKLTNGTNEVMALITQLSQAVATLASAVAAATVTTAGPGTYPVISTASAAAASQIATQLNTLKEP